ncbi:IucA/IucC family siderophore biosynthesis protein [Paenibacillus sp. GSMTC-2017]|uniref:IucA/IucC family protein n=1 Tax=Paenibacillus sp. GSMTC-2017 TaxID=2794350 RepID=UPI0018D8AAF6|nr:IucA/IucC family protein [Paenibacillus sp. GSMTC-2017]MBH5320102.1 IucA/IucC family siderophore biosynthesis protein [Paenibacillus sp. GSMTC-2017]
MNAAKRLAEQATIQSFLNCYLRESGPFDWINASSDVIPDPIHLAVKADQYIRFELIHLNVTFYVGVHYKSPTGRHIFRFPVFSINDSEGEAVESDYVFVVRSLSEQLSLEASLVAKPDELVERVMESCAYMESFILGREWDASELYEGNTTFLEAEQALLLGHLIHPVPKSRQGIPEGLHGLYDPELKGEFQLHYFRAHKSIIKEGSLQAVTATNWVKEELKKQCGEEDSFVLDYCQEDDYSLIPIHPLQAMWLLRQEEVKQLLEGDQLTYLGASGHKYSATSSMRTVYQAESEFMVKGSIPVKITNSLRVNKYKELERGVEVSRLLETSLGSSLRNQYPQFQILCDPAFLTVHIDGQDESGFEVVLRDNPFRGEHAVDAIVVASLFQDPVVGTRSRIGETIHTIAEKEQRPIVEVSLDWFRRYLDVSLEPIVWLYLRYGIALEAHQQNSVVKLENGYPSSFYYRDNQGYYFCKSTFNTLNTLLPGIGSVSETVCEDSVADERLRYYLIFNHMFGVINGFGTAGLIDESILLKELRERLQRFVPQNREPSEFLSSLLTSPHLPCKANLLTRLYDMDELVGAMETQSVYVSIPNPLYSEESSYVYR